MIAYSLEFETIPNFYYNFVISYLRYSLGFFLPNSGSSLEINIKIENYLYFEDYKNWYSDKFD